MKKMIIGLLIGIIAFNCDGQSINNLDLRNEDLSEFEFLREIIGNKRIVCLGEEDHFYGEYFQLKNKVIQFMINELDFSIVAFESSGRNSILTELSELELNQRIDLTMNRYWKTKSVYHIIDAIRKNEKITQIGLDLIGFDDTTDEYLEKIEKILSPLNSELLEEYKTIIREIAKGQYEFQVKNKSIDTNKGNLYRNTLGKVIDEVKLDRKTYSENLTENQIEYLLYSLNCSVQETYFLEQKGIVNHLKFRDKSMSENLDWIIKEYAPTKKIIVWAANLHINRNPDFGKRFEKKGAKSMVEHLDKAIQKEILVLNLSPINFLNKTKDEVNSKVIFVNKLQLPKAEKIKGIDGGFYFKKLTNFKEFLK